MGLRIKEPDTLRLLVTAQGREKAIQAKEKYNMKHEDYEVLENWLNGDSHMLSRSVETYKRLLEDPNSGLNPLVRLKVQAIVKAHDDTIKKLSLASYATKKIKEQVKEENE